MQQVLKLTITAVGEPDSIFLVPCDPITLHESEIETDRDVVIEDGLDVEESSAFEDPADALASLASPEVMILADEPPLPRSHRRAS
ncbi:MAG: hypothetical protein AAF911_13425 [Planctomycetota bacterium]